MFKIANRTEREAILLAREVRYWDFYREDNYDYDNPFPTCLRPYRVLLYSLLASVTAASGAALMSRMGYASGAALVTISGDLLIQGVSRHAAAAVSTLISWIILIALMSGFERPPYLTREHQNWALYGFLGYAILDFAGDWRLQGYWFASVLPVAFLGQFFLNHPVLPLFASITAIAALVSAIFSILYPPLLLVTWYASIISAGMFAVDRQWIWLRPYVIFCGRLALSRCFSAMSSIFDRARAATTPTSRVAD